VDWEERYQNRSAADAEPAPVLAEYAHLLPAEGTALDLACGLGGNAVFLARRGLDTLAWDSSPAAIEQLSAYAEARGLRLRAAVRDVAARPPEPEGFDVIVVSRFLERALVPALVAALRPDGLLYYQTFTRSRVSDRGPGNDRFRLGDNELLGLFGELRLLVYREDGRVGELERGLRDEAQLVAQKTG
jgi:SAM-dependent methyltransferase